MIQILSKWTSEEDIAPYFLKHYWWADQIIIYLDNLANQETVDIIKSFNNTFIIWDSKSNGQMNDGRLINDLNAIVRHINADWLILVDSDEFIFPKDFADPRQVLSEITDGNVLFASMWQIYRHETDADLDPNQSPLMQRRHGDPNRETGFSSLYTKPIIAKPRETDIQWAVGNHDYLKPNPKVKISETRFDGVHWTLPDINMTIKRRIKGRRDRFDEEERRMGWGGQHFDATEETIIAEYELHKNDPQVF